MPCTIGTKFKVTVFGESHGPSVGCVIEGIPAGISLDTDYINWFLFRRRPSLSPLSTGRNEQDNFTIASGLFGNLTSGTPLCAIFNNNDVKSGDYEKIKATPRPGHGDYTQFVKNNGFNDYRGGGNTGGRLTLPFCFAGAVASSLLKKNYNIDIAAHIYSIYDSFDDKFSPTNPAISPFLYRRGNNYFEEYKDGFFPVINEEKGHIMKNIIMRARESGDSVGGIIECAAVNVPAGIGGNIFSSCESIISGYVFSIPGVKGVEFGSGFDGSFRYGSENNDEFYFDETGRVRTYTNNSGGILGGLSDGMPIIFRVAVKPTPSIFKTQKTVNLETGENTAISVTGRHDPCIVPRAVPCVEAAMALSLIEMLNE